MKEETDFPQPSSPEGRLEGLVIHPKNQDEVVAAVDKAFDYRGDVTIQLGSGESIEGYVFSREVQTEKPFLRMFPKEDNSPKDILYQDIRTVIFSGEDTAFGKSWEDWIKKQHQVQQKTADRAPSSPG